MSSEFMLLLRSPDRSTEEGILALAADLLGGAVGTDENGVRNVRVPGLFVHALASDEDDRKGFRDAFGLDADLTLIFEDLIVSDWAETIMVQRRMMEAVRGIIQHAVEGALLEEDLNPDTIILRFAQGTVTLNQDWAGWETAPDLLRVFPEPRTMVSFCSPVQDDR